MKRVLLARVVRKLVQQCAAVSPGERVLVVTDMAQAPQIAELLAAEAHASGAEVVVVTMTPRELDGQEPPLPVAAAMKVADVIFTPVAISITHSAAVREALASGARLLSFTAVSEDLLLGGGADVDFEAIAPTCRAIAERMSAAESATLTTPAGTALSVSLRGRKGNAHTGLVRGRGEISTAIDIEVNFAPVEGSAKGRIVVDGSIPYFGLGVIAEPVTFDVEGGAIVRIHGRRVADRLRGLLASQDNPAVYNIAQVAFGLNPRLTITGNSLGDEGALGTAHVGIGTSANLGGQVRAPLHFDVLMWRPTLRLDGKSVIEDGRVCAGALGLGVY